MARAIVGYDKDLPEIPGRRPWEKPTSYLVKDDKAPTGWREDDSGRRPSRLLLVPKIRAAVDAWREAGYPGASTVTQRLFAYWFEEEHDLPDFAVPFRYHFCQREAIETLAWLVEIAGQRDTQKLIEAHASKFKKDLLTDNFEFQTAMDGRRQLRRYVPELDADGVQDLPLLKFTGTCLMSRWRECTYTTTRLNTRAAETFLSICMCTAQKIINSYTIKSSFFGPARVTKNALNAELITRKV